MNNSVKKRVLKREPVSNLSGSHMDEVIGGTGHELSSMVNCNWYSCDGVNSCEVCKTLNYTITEVCTTKPTSQYTCTQTNWYCCL